MSPILDLEIETVVAPKPKAPRIAANGKYAALKRAMVGLPIGGGVHFVHESQVPVTKGPKAGETVSALNRLQSLVSPKGFGNKRFSLFIDPARQDGLEDGMTRFTIRREDDAAPKAAAPAAGTAEADESAED